jgi:hypothetical protein
LPPHKLSKTLQKALVEALGGAHGGLDGQRAHVLPALLEKGDEVVDGQHDVTNQLVLSHANIADSDTHAEHLLQLELDGGLDLGHLVREVLVVRDGCREFSSLGETGTEETRDLLKASEAMKASYLRASFLMSFLFLLSFFKSYERVSTASNGAYQWAAYIGAHGIDTVVLGTIDVVLVTEDAKSHAWNLLLAFAHPPVMSA